MNAPQSAPALHTLLAGVVDGAEGLASATRPWKAFVPKRDTLDRAIAHADGLARSLRVLRDSMQREQG